MYKVVFSDRMCLKSLLGGVNRLPHNIPVKFIAFPVVIISYILPTKRRAKFSHLMSCLNSFTVQLSISGDWKVLKGKIIEHWLDFRERYS